MGALEFTPVLCYCQIENNNTPSNWSLPENISNTSNLRLNPKVATKKASLPTIVACDTKESNDHDVIIAQIVYLTAHDNILLLPARFVLVVICKISNQNQLIFNNVTNFGNTPASVYRSRHNYRCCICTLSSSSCVVGQQKL